MICEGCGAPKRSDADPFCAACWRRVPSILCLEYAEAYWAFINTPEPSEEQEQALEESFTILILGARLAYRETVLRRLWRDGWRDKFKKKHAMDRFAQRINEGESIPEGAEDEVPELAF